jgi:hypothetical protein
VDDSGPPEVLNLLSSDYSLFLQQAASQADSPSGSKQSSSTRLDPLSVTLLGVSGLLLVLLPSASWTGDDVTDSSCNDPGSSSCNDPGSSSSTWTSFIPLLLMHVREGLAKSLPVLMVGDIGTQQRETLQQAAEACGWAKQVSSVRHAASSNMGKLIRSRAAAACPTAVACNIAKQIVCNGLLQYMECSLNDIAREWAVSPDVCRRGWRWQQSCQTVSRALPVSQQQQLQQQSAVGLA